MRILVVDMWGGRNCDLGYQISSALKHLGHDVRIFDYRKWKLQHFSFTNKWLNARLVATAKNWPAELVLVNKGESILPGTIATIGKAGIKTANWNPDEPFGEIQAFNAIKNLAEYDACFNYDLQYVPRMKEVNPHSYHLPPGADPFEVHAERIPLAQRTFPAAFCMTGTAYPNRVELLQQYASLPMRIAGAGWDKTTFAAQALPHVNVNQMSALFNEAKIVLNPYGASKHFIVPNPRTFEIPASRSFEMTDAKRDVDKLLMPGKEVVIYKDLAEFKELSQYYLEHDEERNNIAEAGYQRVLKEHTMRHRVQTLLKQVL